MCGGSAHSSHGSSSPRMRSHSHCSCHTVFSRFFLSFVAVVYFLSSTSLCARGELVELHKTNSIFRGALGTLDQAKLLAVDPGFHAPPAPLPNIPDLRRLQAHDEDDHDHEDEHGHEHGMTAKRVGNVVGASVAITAVSLVGIFLPLIIRSRSVRGRELFETLCGAFAAGAFWGLTLIHVLVESVLACESLKLGITFQSGSFLNAAYPLAAAGYVCMLLVESTAAVVSSRAQARAVKSESTGSLKSFASVDAVVASLALTVHSFFEGMVVGMREDSLLIWIAAISVIGHKWAAGFSLASRMEHHETPKAIKWSALSIFVLASPLGALVGLPISSQSEFSLATAVLNSLSTGILLYVSAETTADAFKCNMHSHSHPRSPHCDENSIAIEDQHCAALVKSSSRIKPAQTPEHASIELHHHEHPHTPHDAEHQTHDFAVSMPSHAHAHLHGSKHEGHSHEGSAPSLPVFGGQVCLFLGGIGLVFGMMCLHMRNPGHTH